MDATGGDLLRAGLERFADACGPERSAAVRAALAANPERFRTMADVIALLDTLKRHFPED